MSGERQNLGSFRVWLWVRVVEVCVALWWVTSLTSRSWADLLFLVLLLYAVYLMTPMAYGYADSDGIHFRQYLKWNFVTWNDVSGIEWKPWSSGGFKLYLRRRAPLGNRVLNFTLNPSLRKAVSEFAGHSTPGIVTWIQEQITAHHARA